MTRLEQRPGESIHQKSQIAPNMAALHSQSTAWRGCHSFQISSLLPADLLNLRYTFPAFNKPQHHLRKYISVPIKTTTPIHARLFDTPRSIIIHHSVDMSSHFYGWLDLSSASRPSYALICRQATGDKVSPDASCFGVHDTDSVCCRAGASSSARVCT
jgi:hypothetical protein